jgi:hypothetical protein
MSSCPKVPSAAVGKAARNHGGPDCLEPGHAAVLVPRVCAWKADSAETSWQESLPPLEPTRRDPILVEFGESGVVQAEKSVHKRLVGNAGQESEGFDLVDIQGCQIGLRAVLAQLVAKNSCTLSFLCLNWKYFSRRRNSGLRRLKTVCKISIRDWPGLKSTGKM